MCVVEQGLLLVVVGDELMGQGLLRQRQALVASKGITGQEIYIFSGHTILVCWMIDYVNEGEVFSRAPAIAYPVHAASPLLWY